MTQPATELTKVPDLTKWPRLLVAGQPVTEQQANEILIRTAMWHAMLTNDPPWAAAVHLAAGLTVGDYGWADAGAVDEFREQMGVLHLEYLANHRIASPHIIGPHGWCDWDGTISCANYNIGKYPTIEQVWHEWVAIAEAFPYLNLTTQLVPDEGDAPKPVVEFRVFDGRVSVKALPERQYQEVVEFRDDDILRRFTPDGERGVSLERLETALAQVRESRTA